VNEGDSARMSATKEQALRYVFGMQISVIPLVKTHKKPSAESWKEFQSRYATAVEIMGWPEGNIGIVTGSISGLVVVDCESIADAKWFWENRGQTPAIAETPRGIHLYFQHPAEPIMNAQKVKDEAGQPRYDIRGDGGYVVAPPSHVEKQEGVQVAGDYKWRNGKQLVCVEKLPKFNPAWRPVTQTREYSTKRVTDGVKYIAQIRAISGQGGHNDTFRAACRLKDSEMSEAEALAAMIEWNQTNAEPPWSVAELLHKVKDAYSKE
jgi:hypothetical protein